MLNGQTLSRLLEGDALSSADKAEASRQYQRKYYLAHRTCNKPYQPERSLKSYISSILELYWMRLLSSVDISYVLPITPAAISCVLRTHGGSRSLREAQLLAVKQGRGAPITKRGSDSPHYIEDRAQLSPRNRMTSAVDEEWRDTVFKRDMYTCQLCHVVGGKLNAHHIKEFAKYPDHRYDLDNGVSLCLKCHKWVHQPVRYWLLHA